MRVAGLVTAALLLAAPAVHAQQQPQRQIVSSTFTTTEPGAATGGRLDVQIRHPSNPDAKPPALAQIVIDHPEGTRFDLSVPETCTATDAQLVEQGAAACPPGSKVADGALRTDNGSPGGPPRYTDNTLTTFVSGPEELVTVAESKEPPTRVVSRSPVQGGRVTLSYPPVPVPGEEPFLAYTRLQLTGLGVVRDGRAYLRTPEACPQSGAWSGTMTFTYRDGVTQRVETRSPCRRGSEPAFSLPPAAGGIADDPAFDEPRDAAAPTVRLSAPPRRCVRRAFLLRVAVRNESPLRHVVVEVDGRRVALRRASAFRVRVPVAGLRRGRHRIDVLARDRDGDLGGATARFRRC